MLKSKKPVLSGIFYVMAGEGENMNIIPQWAAGRTNSDNSGEGGIRTTGPKHSLQQPLSRRSHSATLAPPHIHLFALSPRPAEGEGFEPTVDFSTHVFKTCALSHSAIPPVRKNYNIFDKALQAICCLFHGFLKIEIISRPPTQMGRLGMKCGGCAPHLVLHAPWEGRIPPHAIIKMMSATHKLPAGVGAVSAILLVGLFAAACSLLSPAFGRAAPGFAYRAGQPHPLSHLRRHHHPPPGRFHRLEPHPHPA